MRSGIPCAVRSIPLSVATIPAKHSILLQLLIIHNNVLVAVGSTLLIAQVFKTHPAMKHEYL